MKYTHKRTPPPPSAYDQTLKHGETAGDKAFNTKFMPSFTNIMLADFFYFFFFSFLSGWGGGCRGGEGLKLHATALSPTVSLAFQ